MKSILEMLYFGEISPCRMPAPTSKKYKDAMSSLEKIQNEISERFPNSKNLIEEYADTLREISMIESERDFEKGFSLGAKLVIDIFHKD